MTAYPTYPARLHELLKRGAHVELIAHKVLGTGAAIYKTWARAPYSLRSAGMRNHIASSLEEALSWAVTMLEEEMNEVPK